MTKTGPIHPVGSAGPIEVETAATRARLDRVLDGDAEAWQQLVAIIHPAVEAMCKQRGYGRPEQRSDVSSEVALRVLERLQASDFESLRRFVESRETYEQSKFSRWLSVLVHHAYVDQLRAQPEIRRKRDAETRSLQRTELHSVDVDSFAAMKSEVLQSVEIRRLMLMLQRADFPPLGRQAIVLWLEGHTLAEVAAILELEDAQEAKRLLHAARQRLRRLVFKTKPEEKESA
jgi:hypothetical protein